MRSVTSFYSGALFRKNMVRSWPLWVSYTIMLLFAMPVQVILNQSHIPSGKRTDWIMQFIWELPRMTEGGLALAFGMAIATGVFYFGYLRNTRASNAMHALPLRRETLFCTNYLSGLCAVVLPNLFVGLLTFAVAACYGVVAVRPVLIWFLMWSAMYFFFYSFAVFCGMLTGNGLAQAAFYGIFNFLAYGVWMLVSSLFSVFLHGYTFTYGWDYPLLAWLTPTVHMSESLFWGGEIAATLNVEQWHLSGSEVLVVYSVVAVLLVAASLLLYRRRHVETAGDVVSVAALRPVFRIVLGGLCGGLAMGQFTAAIFDRGTDALTIIVWTLLWGAACCFFAEMLLRKSFRVLSSWRSSALTAAVLAVLFAVLALDLTGYETRIPDPGKAEKASAVLYAGYPDRYSAYDSSALDVSDIEGIEQIAALHALAIAEAERTDTPIGGYEYGNLTLEYTLTNGSVLARQYTVHLYEKERDVPGTITHQAQAMLDAIAQRSEQSGLLHNLRQAQAQGRSMEIYLENLWDTQTRQTVYSDTTPFVENQNRVLEAVLADYEAGTLGERYLFRDDYDASGTYRTTLEIQWYEEVPVYYGAGSTSRSWHTAIVHLTPRAENTLRVLRELGVITDTRVPVTEQELDNLHSSSAYRESYVYEGY